jgi:alpha-mannosidase
LEAGGVLLATDNTMKRDRGSGYNAPIDYRSTFTFSGEIIMPTFDAERRIELAQLHNRLQEIRATIYTEAQPMKETQFVVTGQGKGPESIPEKGWKKCDLPYRWGGLDQTTWFRLQASIPKDWRGRQVVGIIKLQESTYVVGVPMGIEGGEALAYLNGEPYQGIDRNHETIQLAEKAKGGEVFDIVLEACPNTRHETYHTLQHAQVAIYNPLAWDFYWDCQVPLEVIETMDANNATRQRMQNAIGEALQLVDLQHVGTDAYWDSLKKAQKHLRAALKQFEASYGMGKMVLTGHSHIDTAWLWPLRETQRKVGRTFSTMLRLMERYPEFCFSSSQPQLFVFLKEHYPSLWKQVKKRVKQGQWEPCGAPWVEQDSNVPSGEALIRQFLYGNEFYEKEFGMRSHTAWLPDAFGYPWSLPQILAKCQITTFVTTKIDWGMFTPFPYSYFMWEGVDGTRIRAIMPPLNYNGNPVPKDVIAQRELFKQKDLVDELIFPIGWGDGGGGTTAEMIERGKRLKNMVGVPKCEFGRTQDSLDRINASVPEEKLPVYNGELYLELHRACQISQARTKRNNRQLEVLLHDAEFMNAVAYQHGGKYDIESLRSAWEILLLNQFHDILPGSSITEVYKDTEASYAKARAHAGRARSEALAQVLTQVDTRGPGAPLVVFNTLSWYRHDVALGHLHVPVKQCHVIGPDGATVPSQIISGSRVLFESATPPLGYAVYHVVMGQPEIPAQPTGSLKVTARKMENDFFVLHLDSSGRFTRLYDKVEDREVLPEGEKANVLQLFDDRPHAHDAWDIDHNFDAKSWEPEKAESIEVVEEGPVRAAVRLVRKTERSTITQNIMIYATLPRIDVHTTVDWHEKRTLMKVAFPVDVLSPRATYDIQFASIERATHNNTPYEKGRFEVTAHHWADLSEGDYGVSLLNDCKYSYDVKGNVLRLSLLRSSIDPDPDADQGQHEFTYSLYPHGGDWREGTIHQGYELNYPLVVVEDAPIEGPMPKVHGFACIDADNVILSNIKKAEREDACILRVYEAYGQRGYATLTCEHKPRRAFECDMMEENAQPLTLEGNNLRLYFTPYEIKTIKLEFSS